MGGSPNVRPAFLSISKPYMVYRHYAPGFSAMRNQFVSDFGQDVFDAITAGAENTNIAFKQRVNRWLESKGYDGVIALVDNDTPISQADEIVVFSQDNIITGIGEAPKGMAEGGLVERNFEEAPEGMSQQELNLLQHHRDNLRNETFSVDETGQVSTVYVSGVTGPDGRIYNVPGYFNGQRHENEDEIRAQAEKIGWENYPSYATGKEADAAAQALHEIIDRDADKPWVRKMVMDRGIEGFVGMAEGGLVERPVQGMANGGLATEHDDEYNYVAPEPETEPKDDKWTRLLKAALLDEEAYIPSVYMDNAGNWTAGIGHKMRPEDLAKYNITLTSPNEVVKRWSDLTDSEKILIKTSRIMRDSNGAVITDDNGFIKQSGWTINATRIGNAPHIKDAVDTWFEEDVAKAQAKAKENADAMRVGTLDGNSPVLNNKKYVTREFENSLAEIIFNMGESWDIYSFPKAYKKLVAGEYDNAILEFKYGNTDILERDINGAVIADHTTNIDNQSGWYTNNRKRYDRMVDAINTLKENTEGYSNYLENVTDDYTEVIGIDEWVKEQANLEAQRTTVEPVDEYPGDADTPDVITPAPVTAPVEEYEHFDPESRAYTAPAATEYDVVADTAAAPEPVAPPPAVVPAPAPPAPAIIAARARARARAEAEAKAKAALAKAAQLQADKDRFLQGQIDLGLAKGGLVKRRDYGRAGYH